MQKPIKKSTPAISRISLVKLFKRLGPGLIWTPMANQMIAGGQGE
jgi:hypothetical protein